MLDYKYSKYKAKYLEKLKNNMTGGGKINDSMVGGSILLKRIDPGLQLNNIELVQILQNSDKHYKIIDTNDEIIFSSLKDINIGTCILNRFENAENYSMFELPYCNNLIRAIKSKNYDFSDLPEEYLTDCDFMLFCLRYAFTNINEVNNSKYYDDVKKNNLQNITIIFNKLDSVCCNSVDNIYYCNTTFLLECLKININFIGFIPINNYNIKYPEYLSNLFRRYPYLIKLLPNEFLNNPSFMEKYDKSYDEEFAEE